MTKLQNRQLTINLAEGQMLNGRILPSVASNNLTVALKTLAGTDPSASDPVYVMIGGTLRTITSALSVVAAAGANWFNAGSSELATKEIDYFVYLCYNSTDAALQIGFSRLPGINIWTDITNTASSERYLRLPTGSSEPANSDPFVNIGRFAATLSAGAGYTWSVPTFTASNLIQIPIYETRWLNWTTVFTGFSSDPATNVNHYKIKNDTLWINHRETANGTSNTTGFTISLPFTSRTIANMLWNQIIQAVDNGVTLTTPAQAVIASNGSVATLYKDTAGGAWTGSGGKRTTGFSMFYEI